MVCVQLNGASPRGVERLRRGSMGKQSTSSIKKMPTGAPDTTQTHGEEEERERGGAQCPDGQQASQAGRREDVTTQRQLPG